MDLSASNERRVEKSGLALQKVPIFAHPVFRIDQLQAAGIFLSYIVSQFVTKSEVTISVMRNRFADGHWFLGSVADKCRRLSTSVGECSGQPPAAS
jgi:hypothetical protein